MRRTEVSESCERKGETKKFHGVKRQRGSEKGIRDEDVCLSVCVHASAHPLDFLVQSRWCPRFLSALSIQFAHPIRLPFNFSLKIYSPLSRSPFRFPPSFVWNFPSHKHSCLGCCSCILPPSKREHSYAFLLYPASSLSMSLPLFLLM